jgi:hypothetical protein
MIDMVSLDAHRETSRGKGGLSTRDIEPLFADCAVNRCSAAPRPGISNVGSTDDAAAIQAAFDAAFPASTAAASALSVTHDLMLSGSLQ